MPGVPAHNNRHISHHQDNDLILGLSTRYICIRLNVDVGMNLSDKFRFLFCILLSNFQQFYLFGPACLK